jgi:uracil-DNA glycosylase
MTSIVFIGEAWGEQEARYRTPFVGPAGQELARMLHQASYPCDPLPFNFTSSVRMIKYWELFPFQILNVFNERPPSNEVEYFYAHPKDKTPINRNHPPRRFNNANYYLKEQFTYHVEALHLALERAKPNIIVALGNTALWALGLPATISKLRGNVIESRFGKVLPTYHPAAILRKWNQRTIGLLDLHKALRESSTTEVRTLPREIWTEPSIDDLYRWWDTYGSRSELLAVDIETIKSTQISEIGFAADSTHALHIPFFWKEDRTFISFYPDAETELAAWEFVKMVCESDTPKIGQNVVQYDTYWLLKSMGIQLRNITHDTMTLAHAWQPELEKSLGFLGSIFLDERSWKSIRNDTAKQND